MMTEQNALFPEIGTDFSARKWYILSVPSTRPVYDKRNTLQSPFKSFKYNSITFFSLAIMPGCSHMLKDQSL